MVEYENKKIIKVRTNNQRNIDRVYRWLRLEPDYTGMVWRGGDVVGYKTGDEKFLYFHMFCTDK